MKYDILTDNNKNIKESINVSIHENINNVPSQDINNVPSQDINNIRSSSLVSLSSRESILVNVSTVPSVSEVENEVNIELHNEESSIATQAYNRIISIYHRLQNILSGRRI
jgi:hypothetical protein